MFSVRVVREFLFLILIQEKKGTGINVIISIMPHFNFLTKVLTMTFSNKCRTCKIIYKKLKLKIILS